MEPDNNNTEDTSISEVFNLLPKVDTYYKLDTSHIQTLEDVRRVLEGLQIAFTESHIKKYKLEHLVKLDD